MKNDKFLPYAVIIGIVAIVAIVTLFLWNGRVEGALGYSYVDGEQFPCLDEDPENDFYKAGALRHGKILYEDYCINDNFLYQHYCPISNTVRLLGYSCPNGCLDGACIAE